MFWRRPTACYQVLISLFQLSVSCLFNDLGQNEINAILHDGGCSGAALFVYDTDRTTLLEMYCGELSRGMDVFSSGDELTLSIFTAGGNSSILNFTAHFTSFSEDRMYLAL